MSKESSQALFIGMEREKRGKKERKKKAVFQSLLWSSLSKENNKTTESHKNLGVSNAILDKAVMP